MSFSRCFDGGQHCKTQGRKWIRQLNVTNTEIYNVVFDVLKVVNFNVDKHNDVSRLAWCCPKSWRHTNLATTLKQSLNFCWVGFIFGHIFGANHRDNYCRPFFCANPKGCSFRKVIALFLSCFPLFCIIVTSFKKITDLHWNLRRYPLSVFIGQLISFFQGSVLFSCCLPVESPQ